jgi:hypothetical protein
MLRIRPTQLSGNQERADSLGIAQAAGHLKRWLSVQVQMGASCRAGNSRSREALAEARAEGDVEDRDDVDQDDESVSLDKPTSGDDLLAMSDEDIMNMSAPPVSCRGAGRKDRRHRDKDD